MDNGVTRRTVLGGAICSAELLTRALPVFGASAQALARTGSDIELRESTARISSERVTYATVQTTSGRLRGRQGRGVFSFKGVPYAAATDGRNRFRPPQPVTPWPGVRDALEFGSIAPQENPWQKARKFTANGFDGTIPLDDRPISEDCLCLNVWTSGFASTERRPVMVWFHGGSLIGGSGGQDWYDGANLSQRGNVVVVTVNHRLGALGYLFLKSAGGEDFAASGSVGFLDLVAALEWVRDNIAAFGGDPRQVTIFGESGGGWKVSTLLAMPSAQGLFHRAIIESGAVLRGHSTEQADRVTRIMLNELGLTKPTIEDLQHIPIDRLMAAQQRLVTRVRGGELPDIQYEFQPVVDGVVIPRHPFDPDAPEVSAAIPLLIGTNKTEAAWGLWVDQEMLSPDEGQLRKHLATALRRNPDAVIEFYRRLHPEAQPRDLYILIMSSPHVAIRLAERKASRGSASVFTYLFAWETPIHDGRLKTPHMLEVPFVFNNVDIAKNFTGGGPRAQRLSAKVCDAWVSFARSGKPLARGLPAWPPYTTDRRNTMIFNDECRVQSDPDGEARVFWNSVT